MQEAEGKERQRYAPVMELVDMRDLGSRAAMRVGSSPFRRTRKKESEPALNGARFGFFHSYFYNRQRIQAKTKLAPLELRRQSE